jgi:hypothetical protein
MYNFGECYVKREEKLCLKRIFAKIIKKRNTKKLKKRGQKNNNEVLQGTL